MRPLKLNKQIMQQLKPALYTARNTIKREIEQGVSHLLTTRGGNLLVVLRPERGEMVVVAVVGKNLKQSRQEIIDYIKVLGFNTVRFHTRHPERLQKGLDGLFYWLAEVRSHMFGNDEYVFRLNI